MNILAIDTSTEACSAALLRKDGRVFSEFELAPRQHTRLLPRMMEAVLEASGLSKNAITHCSFSNGPGAFAGVRIAASTAQGIALALDIPLIPISTLALLAQTSFDQNQAPVNANDNILVALDARMGDTYWAMYQQGANGLVHLQGEERIDKLADVMPDQLPARGAGHGWLVGLDLWVQNFIGDQVIPIEADLFPDAASLIKLASQAVIEGRFVAFDQVNINYLRNQVAEKSKKP